MADPRRDPDSNDYAGEETGAGPRGGTSTRTPRWVNVFGIVALVLILLFAVWLLVSGGHGPGRHAPSGDAGGTITIEVLEGRSLIEAVRRFD